MLIVVYSNSLSMFQSALQLRTVTLFIKILKRIVKSNFFFQKQIHDLLLPIHIFQTLKTELYDKK